MTIQNVAVVEILSAVQRNGPELQASPFQAIVTDRRLNLITSPTVSSARWEHDIQTDDWHMRALAHGGAHLHEPSGSSCFSPCFFTMALTPRSFCHRHKLVN